LVLPEPRIEGVRTQLERQFADIAATRPEEFDLSKAWAILLDAKRRGNDLRSVDRKTLRHAPWVIFDIRDGLSPLASDKHFAEAYIRRVMESGTAAAVVNLAHGFLYAYPKRLLTFDVFANALPRLLESRPTARCRRLLDCVTRFRLLKPEGPSFVWDYVARERDAVGEVLDRVGIGETLQRGGFGNAVFEEAMDATSRILIADALAAERTVTRLLDLAKEEPFAGARFRFPSHRAALVERLVLPFAQGAHGEPVRRLIETFVLDHYGDPRIDRSQWHGVSEEAIRVVSGWLVAETLEDFFRLIEHTAKGDPTASRHWRYRKAFWSAYLRADAISDAWIVLASHVDDDARKVLDIDRKAYGRFRRGGGVQANHAALMLRIGDLLITDWSHSGSYRAWESSRRPGEIPAMYKPIYTRFDLVRGADFEGAHYGAEAGTWQRRLSGYIDEMTGIRISFRELMPR
jgi:hypothetical protein